MTTAMLDFPDALEAAGVEVRLLDGWNTPAKGGYYWRESSGDPAGHMHHHTASSSYVPNRTKANAYAGLSRDGSDRLYQEDYGDGQFTPVYAIANAYPAPISSGAGDINVLESVRAGIEVVGRQGPDTPKYYGNTHYWNTEWVLNGIGAFIDERVWEMMGLVNSVQNDLMGWTPFMHIGHYHHTRRKIDLYDGRDQNADETIQRLREDMDDMGMSTEKWAQTLRHPNRDNTGADDFQQMVEKGVISQSEYDYWITVPVDNSEMQDLRNATDVRNPLYT